MSDPDATKNRGSSANPDFGIRVAVVVRRGDEILLVRHEKPGREPYFVLPGGRLEPGETIPACAVREMAEETNLTVEFERVLYVNEFLRDDRHTVDITVEATATGGHEATLGYDPEVSPGEAPTLGGLQWVAPEDIAGIGLLPDPVAARLTRDPTTEEDSVYLGASRV